MNDLFAHSEAVSSIANTNNFIYAQLNGSKYSYVIPIIQFNISHLLAHSYMGSSTENDKIFRFDPEMGA